ncbi:MAG: ATP-binding protein, partial [Bacteroidales bacterium]|nr:ATP-binding protein [Bacteroidales bacterium]
ICDALKKKSGSQISNILSDLENCDFIRSFHTREKKIKKNLKIYQATDFFTIFHLTFCNRGTTEPEYWSKNVSSPKINNWYGLAFERLCFAHISQIKQAIGIHKIYCEYYSWRSKEQSTNSQIDLVIERADKMVNICEIKYSNGPYGISRDEDMKIRTRLSDFKAETGINNGILFTMITTYGLKPSKYNEIVNSQVVIDDLFL